MTKRASKQAQIFFTPSKKARPVIEKAAAITLCIYASATCRTDAVSKSSSCIAPWLFTSPLHLLSDVTFYVVEVVVALSLLIDQTWPFSDVDYR